MHIRAATKRDQGEIREIHLCAFPTSEGQLVSELAVSLLSEKTTPPTISLVAEADSTLIGHVAFSPVTADGNDELKGYILAPLGVKPDYQKRGIGSHLIETGLQQLTDMDVDVLLVYGDPQYYSRFGFNPDIAERYIPPYSLQYPFGWQGITLNERTTPTSPVRINCVPSLRDPQQW